LSWRASKTWLLLFLFFLTGGLLFRPGEATVCASSGGGTAAKGEGGDFQETGTGVGRPELLWPKPPERGVLINIPAFYLGVFDQGQEIRRYAIGIGRAGAPTPTGDFIIASKVRDPVWYPLDGRPPVPPGPGNPLGRYWLGLSLEHYGLHGTNDPTSIGHAVSLGCIRLINRDVEELAGLVEVGTPVRIVYEPAVVEREPVSGRVWLKIYKDLYGRQKYLKEALSPVLALLGFQGNLGEQEWETLERRERPASFPLEAELNLNGHSVRPPGFVENGRLFVPLRPLAEAVGEKVVWDESRQVAQTAGCSFSGFLRNSRLYVPFEEYIKAFPADWHWDADRRRLELTVVTVGFKGGPLTRDAFLMDGRTMVNLDFLKRHLDLSGFLVEQDKVTFGQHSFSTVRRNGLIYVPLRSLVEALGGQVLWNPETYTGLIVPPAPR